MRLSKVAKNRAYLSLPLGMLIQACQRPVFFMKESRFFNTFKMNKQNDNTALF